MAKAPPTLEQITGDLRRRMDGALETLKKEFAGLRTGRASPALLEPIKVEVYGTEMPITQVGTIGVPEPRMLTVQVWDRAAVSAVERAIRDAGLGLNPASDGQTVRVPLPPLTAERRIELAKLAGKYAEAARVAIRAVRRDGMETLRKLEKDHEIGQDLQRDWAEEVQKLTDVFIRKVDEALAAKEADIKQP
jgi:ribosome recycling factor